MLQIRSNLIAYYLVTTESYLDEETSKWDEQSVPVVVLAAGGYPSDYRTGDEISGLPTTEIECIRWPCSTVYGSNTISCVVNIITTREQDGGTLSAGINL